MRELKHSEPPTQQLVFFLPVAPPAGCFNDFQGSPGPGVGPGKAPPPAGAGPENIAGAKAPAGAGLKNLAGAKAPAGAGPENFAGAKAPAGAGRPGPQAPGNFCVLCLGGCWFGWYMKNCSP